MKQFRTMVGAGAVLMTGLVVAVALFNAAPATEFHAVQNESINQTFGNWTQVNETYGEVYYENETVWNSSGHQLVEGTDYQWAPGNQSVYYYNTSNVTENETGVITYYFDAKPEEARATTGVVAGMYEIGVIALIVLAAFGLLKVTSSLKGSTRGRR